MARAALLRWRQRILELGQQLFPVHDRNHTVVAGAIGDVDPILLGPSRNRAMDAFAAIRIMVMGLGLRADHAEVADVYRLCRIAQVVDLQVIAARPSFLRVVGDQIRDAGVAFPPALVRASEVVDDRRQLVGFAGTVTSQISCALPPSGRSSTTCP